MFIKFDATLKILGSLESFIIPWSHSSTFLELLYKSFDNYYNYHYLLLLIIDISITIITLIIIRFYYHKFFRTHQNYGTQSKHNLSKKTQKVTEFSTFQLK